MRKAAVCVRWIALNTGCFWPKNSFLKKPGKFTIEFLPAISNDLNKKEFMQELQQRIETRSKELLPVDTNYR